MIILYSTAALITGFLLDLLIGDPRGFPHIVRLMGLLIEKLERAFRADSGRTPFGEYVGGLGLVVMTLMICACVPFTLLRVCYGMSPWLGFALESLLCWQLIAVNGLRAESMKVYRALGANDLRGAKEAVSMIVGRDTEPLDADGVTRAAVETVAENTSDGAVAPLIFMALGGAVLGCFYKAVNTMDSMLGYKNEKYLHFGRAAALLDDVLNYIPSRLAALLMIISCAPLGMDAGGAYRIWKRDRRKHASPNSAQTESVCAGALGVRLAGPASYFGELCDKPYIGDNTRSVKPGDIREANRLLYAAAALALLLAVIIRGAVYALL